MPIPMLSAIAARARRIRLATGILQPHLRHPVLLAEDWAMRDVLSAARMILGVGLGTGDRTMVEREDELIGIPKARRGQAFDEAIRLVRRLWTEDHVTFEGAVFRCQNVTLGYRPVQQPHPPIVIACGGYVLTRPGIGPNDFYSDRTAGAFVGPFERMARLGDGWITGIVTTDEYRAALEQIHTLVRERHGRTRGQGFRATLNYFVNVGPSVADARRGPGVPRGVPSVAVRRGHARPLADPRPTRALPRVRGPGAAAGRHGAGRPGAHCGP
jgi:alkanesulfonate monooxygenase SsuD/methylene tetrahydromethanopterin reductase-like flavin-dependent oxidoreductase (luciferase family)